MTRGPSQGLAARDDDSDDVRWALQTALAQLKQGGQADAIVWIKRAADAADAAGSSNRGDELRAEARRMAQAMWDLTSGPSSPPAASSESLEIEIDVEPESASQRQVLQPPPGARRPPPLPSQRPSGRPSQRPSLRLKAPGATSDFPSHGPPPLPASQLHAMAQQAPAPPGFSQPPPERQSLADVENMRRPMPSAPQLEVEELDPDALGFDLGDLHSRPPSSGAPASHQPAVVSQPPVSSADRVGLGGVRPSFNDRLSSVDIEPLSVDSVIPQVGGAQFDSVRPVPTSSLPPAPESVRRALTLIDDEEEVEDDEERVTHDFVQPASVRPSQPTSASYAPPVSHPPVTPRSFPPPAVQSSVPPRYQPGPRSVPPQSYPPAPVSVPAASAHPAPSHAPPSYPPASVPPGSAQPLSWQPPSAPPASVPPVSVPPVSVPPVSVQPASAHPYPSAPPASVRPASVQPAAVPADELGELTLEVADLGPPSSAAASDAPPAGGEPALGSSVDGIRLDEVQGFEDLPSEVQQTLAAQARVEVLAEGEEVAFFGAAVVTGGSVDILPAFSDDAGAVAHQADVVFTKGTLADSIELRVVAKVDDTRVAVWSPEQLEAALAECPWVRDELRFIADYFLAVCGAALGPLGERLDDSLRGTVFRRLEVRALAPNELLLSAGENIHSLFVVGGGRLELRREGTSPVELPPGGFVFPDKMMMAQNAPCDVQAGEQGALVLFAPRAVAHELMMSVPPLLEVLAG